VHNIDSDKCEIYVHALAGLSTPQTLNIVGYIKKQKVIVLIDSGSTHNFIYKILVEHLNCFVYPVTIFQVLVVKQKKNKKLAPKFYGPYKIIRRIGQVLYELDFPSSYIHKVFHVSCLKKVLEQTMPVQIELPKLDEEGKLILEP
jgi:hypothetical protein